MHPALPASRRSGACGGGGDGDSTSPFSGFGGGAVTLQFEARAGSASVDCATDHRQPGHGQRCRTIAGPALSHVANVSFVKADGTEVPLTLTIAANDDWNAKSGSDTLTLIDLEDATGTCAGGTSATNSVVTGSVPAGEYVAVKMSVGVPESLNHLDPFAIDTPLALTSTEPRLELDHRPHLLEDRSHRSRT